MTSNKLASLAEVQTALASLGFQVSQETLSIISRTCRDAFLENLSAAMATQDPEDPARKFVANLVRCLSPQTLSKVEQIAQGVSHDRLVALAIATPVRFLSAIDVALDPVNPRQNDARRFVVDSLTVMPPGQSMAQQQPPAPAQRPAAPPPPPAQSTQAGNESHGQQTQPPRTFDTHHVYGSNAALCFNADSYQGKRGIMVDAAAQAGTRAYDWKNAIHLWLDINEVGAVISVLRRWRKSIELSAHGAQNDKAFSIEFQGGHFFAKISVRKSGAGVVRGVKLLPKDATAVCILLLKQLAAEYPTIPLDELLETVRATHQLDNAAIA